MMLGMKRAVSWVPLAVIAVIGLGIPFPDVYVLAGIAFIGCCALAQFKTTARVLVKGVVTEYAICILSVGGVVLFYTAESNEASYLRAALRRAEDHARIQTLRERRATAEKRHSENKAFSSWRPHIAGETQTNAVDPAAEACADDRSLANDPQFLLEEIADLQRVVSLPNDLKPKTEYELITKFIWSQVFILWAIALGLGKTSARFLWGELEG